MTRFFAALGIAALALTLAGCGLRGSLERPPPPMGRETTAEPPGPRTIEAEDPADETPGIGGGPTGIVRPPSF